MVRVLAQEGLALRPGRGHQGLDVLGRAGRARGRHQQRCQQGGPRGVSHGM